MKITRLAATHFRNLSRFDLSFDEGSIVFRGGNGQGKTNLLEAVYVCATGRSFRHASPRELLAFGEERATLEATVVRQDVRHDVDVEITQAHRGMRVDGRHVRHAARLLELVNVVAFFPDDLRVAKGGPDERRRLLDRAIANYRPDFVEASIHYAKVLKSRNVLLRDRGRVDRALLAAFDDQLVRYGAVVHACRADGLAALSPLATERFAAIMSKAGPLRLELKSGVPQRTGEAFADALRRGLIESLNRDLARGVTSIGTHRADLGLEIDGKDARVFASQGQQRALVLALKLAEVQALTARLNSPPILLLDDISSELDTHHTSLLFAAVREVGSQLWISTTGAAPLPLNKEAQVFEVVSGNVSKLL
jgi:DNA replication and repair protein RecF